MNIFVTLFLICTSVALVSSSEKDEEKKGKVDRNGKFLSLFAVVQFKNDPCQSSSGLTGRCYTASECGANKGSPNGNCAAGFGVCCLFINSNESDGTTVTINNTYVQNQKFPAAYTNTTPVSYDVKPADSDICQLRLDFLTFTIAGPALSAGATDSEEACIADIFTVTGSSASQAIPKICGQNSGQHIYVSTQPGSTTSLKFTFDPKDTTTTRLWQIRVSQFTCGSGALDGCLQYFTTRTGRIKTFNFDGTAHLDNQRYSVCIRPEVGMCCIKYQVCSDFLDSGFSLSSGDLGITKAMLDDQCTLDYVQIPGSSSSCSAGNANLHSKYCGKALNTDVTSVYDAGKGNIPICDCSKTFRVGIFTDASSDKDGALNDNQSKGICLDYVQLPCGSV